VGADEQETETDHIDRKIEYDVKHLIRKDVERTM